MKLRKVKIVNKGFNSSFKSVFLFIFISILSYDWFSSEFVFIHNISLISREINYQVNQKKIKSSRK